MPAAADGVEAEKVKNPLLELVEMALTPPQPNPKGPKSFIAGVFVGIVFGILLCFGAGAAWFASEMLSHWR